MLLLRSAQGSPKLAQALRAAGLEVHDLALYTAKALPGPEPLPELDVLTFGSAGGVGAFVEQYGPVNIPAVAIGPVTARRWSGPGCPVKRPRRYPPRGWPRPWGSGRKRNDNIPLCLCGTAG